MTSPLPPDETRRTDSDEEHLKLLGIAHYVMAVLDLFGCAAGAVYVPIVLERSGQPEIPPQVAEILRVALLVFGIGLALLALLSLAMSALTVYAGWSLHQRRNRILILGVSALHLISMPLGTILGVLTIVVMSRPRVSAAFEASRR